MLVVKYPLDRPESIVVPAWCAIAHGSTGGSYSARRSLSGPFQQQRPRSMGPCFRRDDIEYYGVPIPISFSAASMRAGGAILIAIALPVSSRLFKLDRIADQP